MNGALGTGVSPFRAKRHRSRVLSPSDDMHARSSRVAAAQIDVWSILEAVLDCIGKLFKNDRLH